jgi:hypothetical protein
VLADGGPDGLEVGQLLDALVGHLVHVHPRQAELPPSPIVDPLAAEHPMKLVVGDADQPGPGTGSLFPVPVAGQQRLGEGLGGEVGRRMGIGGPPVAEGQDGAGVSVEELSEVLRAWRGQQLGI